MQSRRGFHQTTVGAITGKASGHGQRGIYLKALGGCVVSKRDFFFRVKDREREMIHAKSYIEERTEDFKEAGVIMTRGITGAG